MKTTQHYIAFHLDGKKLKLAHIQGDKKNFNLLKTDSLEAAVKPLYIENQKKSYTLVTGIDSWNLFLREFSFNLRFKREILSILPFQMESQFPYPLDQLILAPIFHKKKESTTAVSLFAVTKEHLSEHLQYFQNSLGIDPDIVSSIPNALFRFATHFFPNHPSIIVYHLGLEKSSYIAISDGKILLSQTQNFGALSSQLDSFEKDLERVCSYIKKKCPPSITELVLAGEDHGHLPFLSKIFSHYFTLLESKEMAAIPIGLCLDALQQDHKSMQFRAGSFISEKRAQKRAARIKTFLVASACLFFIIFTSGHFLIKKKEKQIFSTLNTVYDCPDEDSLETALTQLESSLSKNKTTPFSFSLTVPKVSDLLVWLSSHPKLKSAEGEAQILGLRYQLMKYPQLESPSIPYEARVELEFSTASPRLAREFHEALMKGDSFINAKKEIEWNSNQDHYRTSFYLNPSKGKKAP